MSREEVYSLREAKINLDKWAIDLEIAKKNGSSVKGREILLKRAKEKYEKRNSVFVALKEKAKVIIDFSKKEKFIRDAYQKKEITETRMIADISSLYGKLYAEMDKIR